MSSSEYPTQSPRRLPVGTSDFRNLRRQGLRYVDKTSLIAEVIDGSVVQLFTRPRRFGKTLSLSTLHYFFERHDEDRSDLFEGLAIAQPNHGSRYPQHLQRYPVIFLSLRRAKKSDWPGCQQVLRELFVKELLRLRDLGYFPALDEERHRKLTTWLDPSTPLSAYEDMLGTLSQWLAQECGQPAVVLIDEYDAPIHSAHVGGYYDEAIAFFRNFFTDGLKDNPHLFRGVLTGILRIAKEGLFSGLNNLEVLGILDSRCAAAFGFTEPEVEQLAAEYGAAEEMEAIRAWYNGYRFGGGRRGKPITLYNPWSVLSFLHNQDDGFKPYWVNTSDNALLRQLLTSQGYRIEQELLTLLQGGTIREPLREFLVLPELSRQSSALWSFLLMAGYLRIEASPQLSPDDLPVYELALPNREVATSYRQSFLGWMEDGAGTSIREVQRWCQAIVRGEQDFAQEGLRELFTRVLSYHDLGPRAPEVVYQSFVLGLLVNLQATHRIRSNRESGFGRYDVVIAPKKPGGPGAVLEFKRINSDDDSAVSAALSQGIQQIRDKRYASELSEAGAVPQHAIAIACRGKQVWLRAEPLDHRV